jgi:hypothetical protein
MFYGQCNKCGERWGLGTPSTCTCPDLVTWDASAPIVTTPHPAFKKPWVGLTEEEIKTFYDKYATHQEYDALDSGWFEFAEAIEAKLKEKNSG